MYIISRIFKNMRLSAIKKTITKKNVKIKSGCQIISCDIDSFSYIGYDTKCINTKIGKYCSIADNCCIGLAEHPISFISTSPYFYSNRLVKNNAIYWDSFQKTTSIGNDVWIGEKAFIKAGVSIGDGAIIGMGSVVTHDVGDYEIWAGNPARFIKKRFDDSIIESLLKIKWWDLPRKTLKEYLPLFNDVNKFVDVIKKKGVSNI